MSPSPFKLTAPDATRAREDAWNAYAAEALAQREGVRKARVRQTATGDLGEPRTDLGRLGDAAYVQAVSKHLALMPTPELRRRVAVLEAPGDGSTPRDAEIAWRESTQTREARAELDRRDREVAASPGAALILTTRQSTRTCEKRSVFVKCGCGGHLVDGGCGRADCVRCAPNVTAERARRVYRKLLDSLEAQRAAWKCSSGRNAPPEAAPCGCVRCRASRNPGMWSVRVSVLTMPPELRERYASAAELRKLRREVWRMFRDEFGAAWACVTTHPVGDEDPSVFHPHLNVLWSGFRPGPGMLPAATLERLRARWGDLVGADRPTDVHGSFVPHPRAPGDLNDRKLKQRARYYARCFVAWSGRRRWLPKAVQWYGAYARTMPEKCPRCGAEWQPAHGAGNDLHARCDECGCRRSGYAPPECRCVECHGEFTIIGMGAEAAARYHAILTRVQLAAGPPAPAAQLGIALAGSPALA